MNGWESAETAAVEVGPGETRSRGPPLPAAAFLGCRGKEEGFHHLRLLKPSNTPPKVGG